MKHIFSYSSWLLVLALLTTGCFSAYSQNVGIGTTAPDASAALEIASYNAGLLLPRLTSAQRIGIITPATGLLVFQTDGVAGFYYNAGTPIAPAWMLLNPTPTGTGDNLGNHTATQPLNLQGNALIGTGADIGSVKGVGIRADGGLNLGQNSSGNILLGYQSGQANLTTNVGIVRSNQFVGYQSGANNTTGYQNIFEGYQSGYSNTTGFQNQFSGFRSGQATTTGNNNYFSGNNSGYFNTSGSNNLFIGGYSGTSSTTASENMFVGNFSGYYNTTGDQNQFVGSHSGYRNTTGKNNHFSGTNSGSENTTGSFNQFIGFESGNANTTGGYNQFDGYQSGGSNTTGINNLFVGLQSGLYNKTGKNNQFIGYQSGNTNTTGVNNQFEGYQSGYQNTFGNNNQFSGYQSGYFNIAGNFNSFFGYQSGYNNGSGNSNIFIGGYSGYNNTTGSNNTALGYGSGATGSGLTNTTAVGYAATVSQSNSLALGGIGVNAVSVGIGTAAPSATLHVAGATSSVRLEGLAGTGTRVLTAASNGTLSASTAASLDPTTASNGVIKSGTNFSLGGTLSQATTIDQATNSLGFVGGKIGVGTNAPAATLDVAGSTKLGTTGTVINAMMRLSASFDMSLVPAASTSFITIPIANALMGASVTINPTDALPDGLGIAYAYVMSPGNVSIQFINATSAPIDPPTLSYAILIVQ